MGILHNNWTYAASGTGLDCTPAKQHMLFDGRSPCRKVGIDSVLNALKIPLRCFSLIKQVCFISVLPGVPWRLRLDKIGPVLSDANYGMSHRSLNDHTLFPVAEVNKPNRGRLLPMPLYNFKFPIASPAVVRYNDFVLPVKGRGCWWVRLLVTRLARRKAAPSTHHRVEADWVIRGSQNLGYW